ncbi:hypothetical protein [Nannocystis pusilla]|uniref:hypothetical protein n=1 Tax=Nannocystis pusilla TaxID=889268 RepID=UPI003DA235F7
MSSPGSSGPRASACLRAASAQATFERRVTNADQRRPVAPGRALALALHRQPAQRQRLLVLLRLDLRLARARQRLRHRRVIRVLAQQPGRRVHVQRRRALDRPVQRRQGLLDLLRLELRLLARHLDPHLQDLPEQPAAQEHPQAVDHAVGVRQRRQQLGVVAARRDRSLG